MFQKGSMPWICGLFGLAVWLVLSTAFYFILPEDWLFNHLLRSWVNAVTFYLTAAAFGFIYERNQQLRVEAAWKEGAHLPQWVKLTSKEQIEEYVERLTATEQNKRPNAMALAPLLALYRGPFDRPTAQYALDTQFQILNAEIPSRYEIWFVVSHIITAAGFFGTMLGMSQALPHIDDVTMFRSSLYVAFDTSIVSIFFGQVVRYSLTLLMKYDADVLLKVRDVVFKYVIQAISDEHDDESCGAKLPSGGNKPAPTLKQALKK